MPSSFVDSFAPIVKAMVELQPRKICDVGPGWGKYGLAAREYLPDLEYLVAVEVPEGRLRTQDVVYDRVYTGDVRTFTNRDFWERFELVLLVDIIEHIPKEDGQELLRLFAEAGPRVLVSTPKIFVEQHDPDNPYEDHLCLWEWTDFDPRTVEADYSTIDSIIYLLRGRYG